MIAVASDSESERAAIAHHIMDSKASSGDQSPSAPASSLSMSGTLFMYNKEDNLSFLQVNSINTPSSSSSSRYAIFISGMTEGYLSSGYLPSLAEEASKLNFTFVHPLLRSSYLQYGFGSLLNDCEDLDKLFGYIEQRDNRAIESVCLIGRWSFSLPPFCDVIIRRMACASCHGVIVAPRVTHV